MKKKKEKEEGNREEKGRGGLKVKKKRGEVKKGEEKKRGEKKGKRNQLCPGLNHRLSVWDTCALITEPHF